MLLPTCPQYMHHLLLMLIPQQEQLVYVTEPTFTYCYMTLMCFDSRSVIGPHVDRG